MPVIGHQELIRVCREILLRVNVAPEKAQLVAESLVAADLRGVDSHGARLIPYYVEQIEAGDVDPGAEGRVVSECGGAMVYDGENGLGQWISDRCSDHAIRLARAYGLGMVTVRESNHFGAAAYWAQKMAAAGQIGIVMCNASPIVPPWQAKEPRLGTNPICMALPGPWLLDMATTTVAANKIYAASVNGREEIPAGWAMDAEGRPTTSTAEAMRGLIMPLGGYKGSGLAMMAEILCAVLSGGAMSTELGGIRIRGRNMRVGQMFLAIDIARYVPVAQFTARVEDLVARVKSAAPAAAAGYTEVLVAGDPEWRKEATRRREGIPIPDGTWKALRGTAARVGVAMP